MNRSFLSTILIVSALSVAACTPEEEAQSSAPSQSVEQTTPAPEQEPTATESQQNALEAARTYLGLMAMSHSGLVRQLTTGDGYPEADAIWAVDNVGADWNEQAALAAQQYIDLMPFSHQGLVDQLVHDGFTPEQAEHGVTAVGL